MGAQLPPLLWDDFNGIGTVSGHIALILTKRPGIEGLYDVWGHRVDLAERLMLRFFCEDPDPEGAPDDLVADGVVSFDQSTGRWMALLDDYVRHRSEISPDSGHWAISANWAAIHAARQELVERVRRGELPTHPRA
jgi:hypothetical protein